MASAVLVLGCSSAIPSPSLADLEVAGARWPDATVEELQTGRTLYIQNCAGCHELPRPCDFAPEGWIDRVQEMRVEAEVELTDEEAKQIQRYLYTASQTDRN